MVVRDYICCSTCENPITLRVWVGHNPCQQHTFLCPHCKEEITISMDVNLDNPSVSINYAENCSKGNNEGTIINLNPHFVLTSSDTTSDLSFSWMEQFQYILNHSKIEAPKKPEGYNGIMMLDSYEQLGGITKLTEIWKIIKKGWSLKNNNQEDLSLKTLGGYSEHQYDGPISLEHILFDFCSKLLIPRKIMLFVNAGNCIRECTSKYRNEFMRFREFFINNLKKDHLEKYFDLFSEYFRDYAEYDQTILYIKNLAPVPEGCVATSTSFKNTRMFYGNAYEVLTLNFSVLACLNNIHEGRKFDEFKEMNLTKYLTINKSNRGNPFSKNPDLNGFLGCIDSTLRNASHHGATKLIKHRTAIEFRSGGTGAKQELSYSKYLEKCGDIMLTSAALLMVELVISQ